MPFLVIADCRTASTYLINRLGEVFDSKQEKMCFTAMSAEEFELFLPSSFTDCDGWKLMRYQIPYDRQLFFLRDYCISNGVKIISLKRGDMHTQYRSLEKSLRTGNWGELEESKSPPALECEIPCVCEFRNKTLAGHWQQKRCLQGVSTYEVYFESLISPEVGEIRLQEILRFLQSQSK